MKVLAELKDRKGMVVKIFTYDPSRRDEVMNLYKQGHPDSFDKFDIKEIEKALDAIEKDGQDQNCLLALRRNRVVGAVQFHKWPGPQDLYLLSYIFTKKTMRGRSIGRFLCGVIEEMIKSKARILFTTHAGLLPDYDLSYSFFQSVGFKEWAELPGYFRDDLAGIFLQKRSPYYGIGEGIPEDSGWCPELARSRTGKRVSRAEYYKEMRRLPQVPKGKWGVDLIGIHCVLTLNLS